VRVLVVAPLSRREDTAHYVIHALEELDYPTYGFDSRGYYTIYGFDAMNNLLKTKVHRLDPKTPLLCLILKGDGVYPRTIEKLRKMGAMCFLWHFDVFPEPEFWICELAKCCDHFFTMSFGSVDQYKERGVENVSWLPEACSPPFHHYISTMTPKERAYWGSDVTFAGSVVKFGRNEWLKKIADAGFKLKIWGNNPQLSKKLESCNIGRPAEAGLDHSYVCSASKILLGRDYCPDKAKSMSARLYRTLAAKGFYLTNHTKGIEELFQSYHHLVVYEDDEDCLSKISYFLDHVEEREKIARNGEKEVHEKHTFTHRIKEIMEIAK